MRTWLAIEELTTGPAQQLALDSLDLAKLEGLYGHAKAAEIRLSVSKTNTGSLSYLFVFHLD